MSVPPSEPLGPRRFDPDAALEVLADPVAQWLDWEEQANLIGFRTSTRPVEVEVVHVPLERLELDVLPGAPAALVDRFVRGGHACVARHPLNRDPAVAFGDAPVAERWSARFTSSRTLAFPGPESGAVLFSLKLATDHPHPDFHQPEKTRLREEARDAVRTSRRVAAVDAALARPAGLELISEAIVGLERGGETGFLVRDLARIQDGHYYLPALSLPFVGRPLARRHGAPFADFWGEHYAAAAGRAKARLLLHYGLWYETPNPQNVVVQLDAALRPTGRIVLRDIGDANPATDSPDDPALPWTRLLQPLRPETQNSFWAFDAAGELGVDASTLAGWYARHDAAYWREFADAFPDLDPATSDTDRCLSHWSDALADAAGSRRVVERFARLPRA